MVRVHSAGDLRALADQLASVLSAAPADPMQADLVAVPSAGMRTWLSVRLARVLGCGAVPSAGDSGDARSDGVSANIEFPFPGSLRLQLLHADDTVDPWDVERLPWSILETADSAIESGRIDGVPPLLLEAPPGASRWSAARRVADLFDSYHLHRPAMIQAWAEGRDVDGIGGVLADHHLWQPRLWRSLRSSLALGSPPERMAVALEQCRAGRSELDLPPRICVFGMSLLPGGPGFVDLADALGAQREVHLFVVEPSPLLAERFSSAVAGSLTAATTANVSGHRLRKEVDTSALRHPLLRSWGRMHYETSSVLVDARSSGLLGVRDQQVDPARQGNEVVGDPPGTLLGQLQHQIRADTAPAGLLDSDHPALEMRAGRPRTIEFHACHGPTRQVEVMRDTILRLLDEHQDLDEDDILVVCPDLERNAPVIEATLGPSAHTGSAVRESDAIPTLRYRLADRSLGESVPLVGAFTRLLDLLSGRFDAPSVLDFIALDAVRRRFHFDDDDLGAISLWVSQVNVRWGLDAESREAHGVPASVRTNTWQAGIDRLLLGSAVADPWQRPDEAPVLLDTLGSVIPHSLEGSDVDLAGRLADVLSRLGDLAAAIDTPRPVADWSELLEEAARGLFSVARDQQWQLDRLLRILGELVQSATTSRDGEEVVSPTLLSFTDIRRATEHRVGDVGGRPSFFRGGITISSLTPLRWVPHRVIVMLGMDAEALGSGTTDGDDLAALNPLVGDRDRRNELRQSMLETLLSADEHLVVIRNGHDVRTNQPVPMPVAVAELRDAVLAMVDPSMREDLAARLEVRHPRQSFDEAYFDPSIGGDDSSQSRPPPRSYDRGSLAGAISRRRRSEAVRDYLEVPLEPPDLDEVTLPELHRFLKNPIRFFIERRLDMRLPRDEEAPVGTLAASVSGLDAYALGDRLLSALFDSDDVDQVVDTWRESETRVGSVPAGRLGEGELLKVELQVRDLHHQCRDAGVIFDRSDVRVPIDLTSAGGVHLVGSVGTRLAPDSRSDGGTALVRFVKRRPEHGLSIWLDLAALTLALPDQRWRGVVATRAEKGTHTVSGVSGIPKVDVSTHALSTGDPVRAARAVLDTVLDLYRRGMCEPLPLFRKLSADAFARPRSIAEWPDRFADGAEMLVYGHLSASEIRAMPVLDRDPEGTASDRLGRYAEHLFEAVSATTAEPAEAPR